MNRIFDRKFGKEFLRSLPAAAGVYIMRDNDSQIIYVGKACDLQRRLSQYRLASKRKKHRKMRTIIASASRIDIEVLANEQEALLRENQLIQQYKPHYNIAGKFAFLYPYLGLNIDSTVPRQLMLCYTTVPNLMQEQGFTLFGAFRTRHAVREAYRAIIALFSYIGHQDRGARIKFGRIPYSSIAVLREIPAEWAAPLAAFYRGEERDLLEILMVALLDKSSARGDAATVSSHFRILRSFFDHEAQNLRRLLTHHNISSGFIPQSMRDPLMIISNEELR